MGVSPVGEGRGAGHLCQSWAPRPPEGPASPVHTRSSVPSKPQGRASLVAQWLRICLLMQGTRVRALVWEDPTCHGAAGPVSHNC